MAEKKKWIGKAIKHPGRLTEAASRNGISKLAQAEKWSHSTDPSKRGAGNLGKRFIKGKLHEGGVVKESGLYEMKKNEIVIPAKGGAYQHQEVSAQAHTPGSEGVGHWEIDGDSQKFVKE